MDYMFMTRPFWLELSISQKVVKDKFIEYFGTKRLEITSRKDASEYLLSITGKIQEKMVSQLKSESACYLVKDLYKILDEVFHFYQRQKDARKKLIELNIQENSILDVFEENRNKSCNVIDAVNLWIENAVLLSSKSKDCKDNQFEVNDELFVEMYIYGVVSQALSLISLSRKFQSHELYTGIVVNPTDDVPVTVLKYHPIIYFNTAMTGNQNILIEDSELAKASKSIFGKGFFDTYGVDFIYSLRIMSTFQAEMLHGGKYAMTVINKEDFISEIERYGQGCIDAKKFFDAFVLTKEIISSQKKNNEPIVWIMKTNQYRHELRPFICLENDRIYVSYCAIEQAKHLWCSIYLNGGMCYSNAKDSLTAAIERKNEELSDRLVNILRTKLRAHYEPTIDEIDVKYDRIFGSKDIDYGDYDVVFYTPKTKEVFLIEAKFFSDSLNSSGVISDYEKMFKEKGYYDHCRARYDLVLREKEKLKEFLNIPIDEKITAHFLFVSSKPLEIEFQDEDGVVTFPCLSIFDKYIEGKLLPETGDEPVRPVHLI